jgi:thiol-disulfide isomerase/thioredoxin
MKAFLCLIALTLATASFGQDTPQTIAKKDLPKEATCAVCTANGAGHEEEKPAAGMMYKGKAYYFCNAKEIDAFKKNPEVYVPLELPMTLPELGLTDESGKAWDANSFKGKLVLLDYWATWCKPCLALKPKLDKIRAAYKEQGFEVLSVSIDEKRETLTKFLTKSKWENPVALDKQASWGKLRIVSIPALFLVKDGQIVAVFRGAADAKEIEAAVKANLIK